MTTEEYWFWLCSIEGMWQQKIAKLISIFKNPANIYHADKKALSGVEGIKPEDIENIIESKNESDIYSRLIELKKNKIKFIYPGSNEYPDKLMPYENRPYCLFVKGEMPDEDRPAVAIVGARNCSNYGKSISQDIAYELAHAGIQVISGMARGIDSYAHRGAINANRDTYAVLGNGIDICYPRENIELYTQIQEKGGLISEYFPGTKPLPWQFPHRNRIISGLADAIITIEAREKSGSLITAEWALEQGKDVCAVPGRITDELSKGCNRLIKSGAAIVTCAQDVIDELGIDIQQNQNIKKINIGLEKDLKVVYSCVDLSTKHINTIIEETGYSYEDVASILTKLQMLNLVEESSKGYYVRKV